MSGHAVRRVASELARKHGFYLAVALFASAPAWIVRYPPIVDLPFHLAAIRILHGFDDPAFGFSEHFTLTLGRTQYLAYYLAGSALAHVVGVVNANVALVSIYLGGTVLAMRSLLRALGSDERLSVLVVPLLVNVMFMLGLLPFLLGIPLMLWAFSSAVRWLEAPTRVRGLVLGGLALVLFYTHVFPFAIFAIGFVAMFPWRDPKLWLRALAPLGPALAATAWWMLSTPAGKLTTQAASSATRQAPKALGAALADVPNWFTDVFHDSSDERSVFALMALLAMTVVLGLRDRARARRSRLMRRYALVLAACVLLYFTLPGGYGHIWLIYQRIPIVVALLGIPLLPLPTGRRGTLVTVSACGIGFASIVNTCRHFIAFQREEVGAFDAVLAATAPRKKLCALIFDTRSRSMKLDPFVHFGAYYQVRNGGVVQFSYAGYPHWPIDYRSGKYPPPGTGPARWGWEWTAAEVTIDELYPYYDYVLTRGEGFDPPPGTFRLKLRRDRWALWERE